MNYRGLSELADFDHITGVILAVSGTSPGPASGITYRIGVNWRGTSFEVDGQSPSEERWPDTVGGEPFHVRAVNVGRIVHGDVDTNTRRVYWWFRELPDLGPCADTPGGGSGAFLRTDRDGRPIVIPPPPPPSGAAGSVQSAPDGGGEGIG